MELFLSINPDQSISFIHLHHLFCILRASMLIIETYPPVMNHLFLSTKNQTVSSWRSHREWQRLLGKSYHSEASANYNWLARIEALGRFEGKGFSWVVRRHGIYSSRGCWGRQQNDLLCYVCSAEHETPANNHAQVRSLGVFCTLAISPTLSVVLAVLGILYLSLPGPNRIVIVIIEHASAGVPVFDHVRLESGVDLGEEKQGDGVRYRTQSACPYRWRAIVAFSL